MINNLFKEAGTDDIYNQLVQIDKASVKFNNGDNSLALFRPMDSSIKLYTFIS